MAFATVTPSFVILGDPHDCSKITLRPYKYSMFNNGKKKLKKQNFGKRFTLGPMVTATASAKISTPCNMEALTSAPNLTSLAYVLDAKYAWREITPWRKMLGSLYI